MKVHNAKQSARLSRALEIINEATEHAKEHLESEKALLEKARGTSAGIVRIDTLKQRVQHAEFLLRQAIDARYATSEFFQGGQIEL